MSPTNDGWSRTPISSRCCSRSSCCCMRSRTPSTAKTRAMDSVASARSAYIRSAAACGPTWATPAIRLIDEVERLEAVQEQVTIALQNYPNSGVSR